MRSNGNLGTLFSRGAYSCHKIDSSLFYHYQSVSSTSCIPQCSQSISLSSTFPWILHSFNLSLSVSFTTIYLSSLPLISLPFSSTFLFLLRVLKCLIRIHSGLGSFRATFIASVWTREPLISSVNISLSVLSFPCSASRLMDYFSEFLFVMISQGEWWRESIFGLLEM